MSGSGYNIAIVGQTGVGKSSLLNYLLDLDPNDGGAKTGVGAPVTKNGFHQYKHKIKDIPVCVFDSWGLEVGKEDQWTKDLENELKNRGVDKPASKWFHSVFYCIAASGSRVQDADIKIIQKFRLDWNYHSNNIEGNSLTYGETKSFLLHGLTAQGKPLKDHLDIKGHNDAILWLDDILKNNTPLTEKFIRELHQLILVEPYDSPAITADGQKTTKRINIGEYKRQPNHVKTATGEIFYFSTPEETPAKMHELLTWYNQSIDLIHPIILAAELHYKFITIHPFDDGNGRISRILMNLILMKNGYPPIVIKTNKKDEYFRALRQADGGDDSFFRKYQRQSRTDF